MCVGFRVLYGNVMLGSVGLGLDFTEMCGRVGYCAALYGFARISW